MSRVSCPETGEIFSKCYIKNPMNFVLDSPMCTHGMRKYLYVSLNAKDIVFCLFRRFFTDNSLRFYHPDASQLFPISILIECVDDRCIINNPICSGFLTSMSFFYHLGLFMLDSSKTIFPC